MSKELSFKERLKLWTIRHRDKALLHSIIALIVLAIPFFGHQLFFSASPPSDTRPDNVEYRMSMVGDMMMGRHVHDAAIRSNEPIDRVFDYVHPFFEESDYVTGNFETPILNVDDEEVAAVMDDAELHNKDIHIYSEPWAMDALVNAGFDSVSFANNHALDFGDLSLQQTLEHIEDAPIETVGIGDAMNLSDEEIEEGATDAAEMSYFDINDDVRAGIIGFTDVFVQGFSAQDYVGGVFTPQNEGLMELRNRLLQAKAAEEDGGGEADVVIVHIHWGDEYQVGSNDTQEERAQYLANYGADIIIGHHSHVLEPVTVVEGVDGNRAIVMNSMGNFVFDQGWTRTKESAIAQLDFLDDGSKQLSFVPMYIEDTRPRETAGLTKFYRDYRIFRTLRKELDNEWWTVEDGRLNIDLDKAGVLEGVEITS
ncbi:poly-gamma-glutamate synthesis protein (capsule biosynthesis protein) [Virgibacillus natechei]|uniref:Poly-gamma-glutamate synthesis protein (Capsule biosynthesis protein) n=1 Tax=Virgibacillus natechei TaxID=1216297 RepID=A0ABS4IEU2_9BACI|nr:CapA family protein [Virgibacillus natechei]MBP1969460.1 poly-gamma-glutamate synthesis protein (capsule biosynthesis protein) [Virgibacillus natechei]UZD11832.1 CapA family protein [Virgibacillus natechei]